MRGNSSKVLNPTPRWLRLAGFLFAHIPETDCIINNLSNGTSLLAVFSFCSLVKVVCVATPPGLREKQESTGEHSSGSYYFPAFLWQQLLNQNHRLMEPISSVFTGNVIAKNVMRDVKRFISLSIPFHKSPLSGLKKSLNIDVKGRHFRCGGHCLFQKHQRIFGISKK